MQAHNYGWFTSKENLVIKSTENGHRIDSPGAYVVNESPVRLSGCRGATYINVLRGHQGHEKRGV